MKHKLLILSFLLSTILVSCSWFKDDQSKFVNAYKEILIIRSYGADSSTSNPKIREVLAKYGFTEASFREKFFKYAQEKPEEFKIIIDSIRNKTAKDMMNAPAPQPANQQTPNNQH